MTVQAEAGQKPLSLAAWPLLVINLDRSAVRWREAASAYAAAGLSVERLPAVDGESLSEAEVGRVYDGEGNRRLYKRPLTRGEIGCYLSHREAWRRIAASGAAGGYVFEDDGLPTGRLAEAMALVEGLAWSWDMIKLYSDRPLRGRLVSAGPLSLRRPAVLPARTLGYAVSRGGAEKLLGRSAPFFRPLDMDLKHWWEKDLTVLVIEPCTIALAPRHSQTSAIQPQRAAEEGFIVGNDHRPIQVREGAKGREADLKTALLREPSRLRDFAVKKIRSIDTRSAPKASSRRSRPSRRRRR